MSEKDEKVMLTKNGKDNVLFNPKVAEYMLKNGWKKGTGDSTPSNPPQTQDPKQPSKQQ